MLSKKTSDDMRKQNQELASRQSHIRVRIVRNAIRCNLCGDEIESRYRHDYVTCKCGACSVDGGLDYLRRCGDPTHFTDISVCTEDIPESNDDKE